MMFMKIKVNNEACIGCGACLAVAEDLFEMTDEGLSKVKVDVVPEDKKEALFIVDYLFFWLYTVCTSLGVNLRYSPDFRFSNWKNPSLSLFSLSTGKPTLSNILLI